jgi:hypothetical protein
MGIPDGDLSPRGTGMGKKCPPQAFVGIPVGKFFRRGDGFGELKPDGEFPVAIPSWDSVIYHLRPFFSLFKFWKISRVANHACRAVSAKNRGKSNC